MSPECLSPLKAPLGHPKASLCVQAEPYLPAWLEPRSPSRAQASDDLRRLNKICWLDSLSQQNAPELSHPIPGWQPVSYVSGQTSLSSSNTGQLFTC